MEPLPLISAIRVAGFAEILESVGAPPDRYLERAHIAPKIREDPRGFVPGRSSWAFIGEATRREGLRDFCLDLARLSDWRRGAWVAPLAWSATLGDAIRAMCSSYVREVPMARLGLSLDGPVAWFWRRRVGNVGGWDGSEPAEQYMLSFMLEVIRAGAGPSWLPERLVLESGPTGWASATAMLPGVRIEYDRSLLALAIPLPLLSLPVSIDARPAASGESDPPPEDFHSSVRDVLRLWIRGGLPTQEVAAERLGTSVRSLRRRLVEEGTSWRAVVQDLLFESAVARLGQGRASVREIAEELGYSDAAHFTRFFRSRAGVPPSAWRAQVERATEIARGSLS